MELGAGIPRDLFDAMVDCAQTRQIDLKWLCGLYRQGQVNGKAASEGVLTMAVARLGGIVEGNPTGRHNFLQRIDELVRNEAAAAALLAAPPAPPQEQEPEDATRVDGPSNSIDSPTASTNEPPTREYRVRICDQCYRLEGEMCHNPSCVFCRRTMQEVGEFLDALLIRPVVDGERLDLHPQAPVEPTAHEGETRGELSSEQLANIFEDMKRMGDRRAAWDRLSEDDRFTIFMTTVSELASASSVDPEAQTDKAPPYPNSKEPAAIQRYLDAVLPDALLDERGEPQPPQWRDYVRHLNDCAISRGLSPSPGTLASCTCGLDALLAERDTALHEKEEAYGYLSRLFLHCAPQCEVLPSLLGVCTQIDNYIAGLSEPNVELKQRLTDAIEERDRLRAALEGQQTP